jgi:hypothetical protein
MSNAVVMFSREDAQLPKTSRMRTMKNVGKWAIATERPDPNALIV